MFWKNTDCVLNALTITECGEVDSINNFLFVRIH